MSATNPSLHDKIAAANKIAKLPAKQAGGTAIKNYFEANKKSMLDVLPKHVSAERMLSIAMGSLRKTPALMECTLQSLMGAVMQCSQLGLEPNTPLGHVYLIPFGTKDKKTGQWKKDVQVVVGYRGLIDLARRSGQIESICAHAVHEYDEFDFCYGLNETLVHKPNLTRVDRGQITAFYAVARLKGGGYVFEVMSRAEVDGIRDASQNYANAKAKADTVWGRHYAEMGRKTVIRRLSKYLPMSIELATAVAMDEQAERGETQHLEDVLTGEYVVDEAVPEQEEPPQEDEPSTPVEEPPPPFDPQTGEIALSEKDILGQLAKAADLEEVAIVLDTARSCGFSLAAMNRILSAGQKRQAELTR